MDERTGGEKMAGKNSNFKKAVNELLGTETKSSTPEPREKIEKTEKPVRTERVQKPEETSKLQFDKTEKVILPISREEAVIPTDMVITGNVMTKSNMRIMGSIVGDVACEGNVSLMGSIKGNVTVGNLTIQHGHLEGDITAQKDITVEADSVLKGNLKAENVYSNAATEGQIEASGTVELKEAACVHGDIKAGSLTMSVGAKIKGMVDVSE